ncbi:Isopenicillin N epimerase [Anatilimnocola aggregata]|uniref:Isopenicillin N epimerase n=2 Tax=Anatilimnocola aggregata TaxID=2528021 RepID=A0A517YIT9_9BACT|nr:Isopenicillin N epimerase [Anatilimnocola aggregata]
MPVVRRFAYFDHAAVGPLPEPSRRAVAQWLTEATELGDTVWPRWNGQLEQARRHAAELMGAELDEIALIPNTTAGINYIAQGFPWQAGDNVVTLANEFPSNAYPWLNLAAQGVQTRLVDVPGGLVDLNRLEEAIDERTRLLSLSWIGYASGYRIDLDEVAQLCQRKNIFFFLDAIQGLGVFPIDVRRTKVDFLAADGHKWLLGPEGAGLMFMRREHLDFIRPAHVGWNSVQRPYEFDRIAFNIKQSAARYEGGAANMGGQIALAQSLGLLRELGVSPQASPVANDILAIAEHARQQLARCGARLLSPNEPGHTSGIVTFAIPGTEPTQLREKLLAAEVVVSCRGGGVRISLHGYNNAEDIARMIAVIEASSRD